MKNNFRMFYLFEVGSVGSTRRLPHSIYLMPEISYLGNALDPPISGLQQPGERSPICHYHGKMFGN